MKIAIICWKKVLKILSIICYLLNKQIPDPSKAKIHYEIFLKDKARNNPNASKTEKKPPKMVT